MNKSPYAYVTHEVLQQEFEENQTLLWYDAITNSIGIANSETCVIIPKVDVSSIEIVPVQAWYGNQCRLYVLFESERREIAIFKGETHYFSKEDIASLFDVPVTEYELQYDQR